MILLIFESGKPRNTKLIRMTRIVLEVSQEEDLDLLLALLKRLDIRIVQETSEGIPEAPTSEERGFILQGLPEREDFEDFVKDFDKK